MHNAKTHIYFVPGLAASSKIFEFLTFDDNKFSIHHLEWLLPNNPKEPLEDYAYRMSLLVKQQNAVLVGVSFGGILVQEMSKFLNPKKVIIISSVKSYTELPNHLKLIKQTNAYKLFPVKAIKNIEEFSKFVFGDFAKKRVELYKKYLSVRNETYLKWAIYNVLYWKQFEPRNTIIHIHGENDAVFPIKNIQNCIEVKQGTHVMIINKAKTISKLITDTINDSSSD